MRKLRLRRSSVAYYPAGVLLYRRRSTLLDPLLHDRASLIAPRATQEGVVARVLRPARHLALSRLSTQHILATLQPT